MKLNNKGFGTKDMIIYSCVIIFFLLLADLLILSFYRDKDKIDIKDIREDHPSAKSGSFYDYYIQQENNLKAAGLKYARANNLNLTSKTRFNISVLVENGYISYVRDSEDNTICSGYIVMINNIGDYDIESYIKCNSYTTEGYE
jgi:hypothetical protein